MIITTAALTGTQESAGVVAPEESGNEIRLPTLTSLCDYFEAGRSDMWAPVDFRKKKKAML
jgi:hypothetical protein